MKHCIIHSYDLLAVNKTKDIIAQNRIRNLAQILPYFRPVDFTDTNLS